MRLSKDKIKESSGYKFDIFLQNFIDFKGKENKSSYIPHYIYIWSRWNLLFVFIRKDIPWEPKRYDTGISCILLTKIYLS